MHSHRLLKPSARGPQQQGELVHSGRVSTFPARQQLDELGEVQTRLWHHGDHVADDVPFDSISEHLAREGDLLWVGLANPSRSTLERLGAELNLDPQAVEDALNEFERPKTTSYDTHTFLTVYAAALQPPGPDGSRIVLSKVSAFVFPRGVITVHYDDGFDMAPVIQRWTESAALIRYGKSALVHGMLDFVVDGYFEVLQALDDEAERIEDELFDSRVGSTETQIAVYRLRKELMRARRIILPMREVVSGIVRHRREMFSHRELDSWFDDLYDHALRAAEWTESLRDMVANIVETNMSLQDARRNVVMRQLAAWAAIIAVPTAITGWFGQNVPYPGYETQAGLWLSTGLIVILVAVLFVAFRKRGWL